MIIIAVFILFAKITCYANDQATPDAAMEAMQELFAELQEHKKASLNPVDKKARSKFAKDISNITVIMTRLLMLGKLQEVTGTKKNRKIKTLEDYGFEDDLTGHRSWEVEQLWLKSQLIFAQAINITLGKKSIKEFMNDASKKTDLSEAEIQEHAELAVAVSLLAGEVAGALKDFDQYDGSVVDFLNSRKQDILSRVKGGRNKKFYGQLNLDDEYFLTRFDMHMENFIEYQKFIDDHRPSKAKIRNLSASEIDTAQRNILEMMYGNY